MTIQGIKALNNEEAARKALTGWGINPDSITLVKSPAELEDRPHYALYYGYINNPAPGTSDAFDWVMLTDADSEADGTYFVCGTPWTEDAETGGLTAA